ncbi:MAG: histidine phosphatase family protein [Vicinamibacterales bacterium]
MLVVLVHHAQAVGPDVDHMRPLSAEGRRQADRVAAALAARGVAPAVVWHSGKLRARQTAEACWRALNPFAAYAAARGLQPSDAPEAVATALLAEDRDVLIAGHLPNLPRLLRRLVTGHDDGGMEEFPAHGAVALERRGDRWTVVWEITKSGDLVIL